MRKLTIEHVTSISHLEQYIFPHLLPNMPPRQRQEIEDDLERLAQIKNYILSLIYEPILPLAVETPKEDQRHGDTNPTS